MGTDPRCADVFGTRNRVGRTGLRLATEVLAVDKPVGVVVDTVVTGFSDIGLFQTERVAVVVEDLEVSMIPPSGSPAILANPSL
jgi:hypothetical protein